ncbi:MAG: hypothetical protein HEQ38_17310 [Gemmatimonas sp.]|nr:hypothetical protein [Gemmatimonas sp.]
MSRRENGYVAVRYADGGSMTFAASERERIETAWRNGDRYFEGRDEYGGEGVISLDGVRAVWYFSPDALAASREEDRLDQIEGVT